ncbi:hypothetical protein CORC01_12815 [Colletotrichum orchidophilum]|uniref:Uncharacterized protein n=1 Tax=Colletotrichum orchidophilum TaxID=1209926 RepID=A0A1G4AS21_9PEZI|nr:uncharacterized protein CORC01_12815 [Colletotrichum orchidophilum]OHE91906.1 hypothetical protein CORC01_12815 [Colletotrichum orchidophilum]
MLQGKNKRGRNFRPTANAKPKSLGSIFHRRPSPSPFISLFLSNFRSPENVTILQAGTMSRDLERLIESVITDISCYGDLGCTVLHVLDSLGTFYKDTQPRQDASTESSRPTDAEPNQLLWSTAWDWLRVRKDISVGPNRKWNHVALLDILTLPDPDTQDGMAANSALKDAAEEGPNDSEPNGLIKATPRTPGLRKRPRIYVSEDRMWESIAGHTPDYRRVPRLEWMALVGIASTKQQGILQGDLGRLVGQDKRSLPKRTDALAEKGYISKRTTLVRGTKTSKMWLTRFAPALPVDPLKATASLHTAVDMSRSALACDLEPVSWRHRWNGDSVDYISLAQTIMAIVKAFGIIRYHDLRCKLGILGLRWQMKVAAKTCRFFVQTGAIQYVGATLSGKLFKDCLKFDHDLTHEDWAAYLATGKQKSISSALGLNDGDLGSDPADNIANVNTSSSEAGPSRSLKRKRVNPRSNWIADKPLTTTVFDNISAAGTTGLSNKQIGDFTLGASFRRYISSISSTISLPAQQPVHLKHFQVSSEMHRKGKSQQYRYFACSLQRNDQGGAGTEKDASVEMSHVHSSADWAPGKPLADHFTNPTVVPEMARTAGGLAALAQVSGKALNAITKRKTEIPDTLRVNGTHGAGLRRAKRIRLSEQTEDDQSWDRSLTVRASSELDSAPPSGMATRRGMRRRPAEPEKTSSIVTLKVDPPALSRILNASNTDPEAGAVSNIAHASHVYGTDKSAIHAIIGQDDQPRKPSIKDVNPPYTTTEGVEVSALMPQDEESIIVASRDSNEDVEVTNAETVDDNLVDDMPVRRGGRRTKKGTGNSSTRSRTKIFKCDKCGGTWKNDVGIKYHLEKSKTSCNPSYVAPLMGPPETLFPTAKRPAAPKRAVIPPRQMKSRQTRSSIINDTPDDERSQEDAFDVEVDSIPAGVQSFEATLSRGRRQRTTGGGNFVSLEESRQGERKGTSNYRSASKPSSTLKPPVSSTQLPMSGLIDDPAGAVRDMPTKHASLQPALGRSRGQVTPKAKGSLDSPESRKASLTDPARVDPPPSLTPTKAPDHFGRRGSFSRPVKRNTNHSLKWMDPGNTLTSVIESNRLPHAEALRASLNDSSTLSKTQIVERALLYILHANGGVFPGGQSLWYATIATWEVMFSSEESPDYQFYKSALARLAKKKQVVVSTHAFKDSKGMMANYQLIRIPGTEASSPAGAAMKANIMAHHPRVYIPPAFTPKAGLPKEDKHDAQPVFSSRRKTVQVMEVLDAPFYANKAANDRPGTPPEGSQTPRKRRKRMVTKEQIAHAEDEGPDGTRRRDIFRFFMTGQVRSSDGPSASSRDGQSGCTTSIVFLRPNTCLGHEAAEDVRRALLPDLSDPEPTYLMDRLETDAGCDELSVTFTHAGVIEGNDGTWPAHKSMFFEIEDRSLTISGWMPDSRWFLRQNLPQSLSEMTKWPDRPKDKFPSSSQFYEFSDQVDACFDWELSTEGMKLLLAESIAPDYIFINHDIGDLQGVWESPQLEWDPVNQLSPSALFNLQIAEQGTTATDHLWGGELGRQRRRKRRHNKLATEHRELMVGIDLKIRTLIPLPRDMDLRDVSRRNAGLDETNETILIAAFVVTRTLLGGADRIIEWGLMMTLFPDMALSAMRRFWSKARKDRGTFINQLTERFQIQFISAYENNEFPPVDYDNYVDYDWPRLVKWTAGLIEDSQELPANKIALERGYSLGSAWTDVTNWRDDYYNFQMSVFNRFEAATSRPATSLVDKDDGAPFRDTDHLVTAMSWLRSLCYTHRDKYAPQDIRKKMASIGGGDEERIQSLLEQAVEILQGQGVITDSKLKALEGRPYRLTETFLPRFMKWTNEVKFIDAAKFKHRLDVSFRRGEKIRIPYVLRDGEVMAMMNLQASGRVAVTTVDVPSIPLGFDPGNYESRKYPKSYYNFGLEIEATTMYVYNEDLALLQKAKHSKPPRENHNRAIPLWSDFFGELNMDRWAQVLGAVAFVVATRGPLDVASVCTVLKPYLHEFEVQMVFDWGKRYGVLKGIAHGLSFTVDEWWWLLVGQQRNAM